MSGRSMREGLLAWKLETASSRPSPRSDCRTVKAARESLVARKSGHVSLTQLKPISPTFLEMASSGCLLSPSATTPSRWATQFTHASFTLRPSSSTIHRELADSGSPPALQEAAIRRNATSSSGRRLREGRSRPISIASLRRERILSSDWVEGPFYTRGKRSFARRNDQIISENSTNNDTFIFK